MTHDHSAFEPHHDFLGRHHARSEMRARLVAGLTFVFMLVEIAAGLLTGSMALLADGIHMATHAGALALAALGYYLARRYAGHARFSFGTGKFGDLFAFANAVLLGVLALFVAAESLWRLVSPQDVAFGEALVVAAFGLVVNLVSAALLHDHHDHDAHDSNLRAAYLHVLADALTSVLALAALAAGLYFHIGWADALAGIVGAVMIGIWSVGLLRDSALVLLDAEDDPALAGAIKQTVERDFAQSVCDFHLWRLGPGHHGLILSLAGDGHADIEAIKAALRTCHPSLSHITVETVFCAHCARGRK